MRKTMTGKKVLLAGSLLVLSAHIWSMDNKDVKSERGVTRVGVPVGLLEAHCIQMPVFLPPAQVLEAGIYQKGLERYIQHSKIHTRLGGKVIATYQVIFTIQYSVWNYIRTLQDVFDQKKQNGVYNIGLAEAFYIDPCLVAYWLVAGGWINFPHMFQVIREHVSQIILGKNSPNHKLASEMFRRIDEKAFN